MNNYIVVAFLSLSLILGDSWRAISIPYPQYDHIAPRSHMGENYLKPEELATGIFVSEPLMQIFVSQPPMPLYLPGSKMDFFIEEETKIASGEWKSELRKIFENQDIDSPAMGNIQINNGLVNNSGYISFKFTPYGQTKNRLLQFPGVYFDPTSPVTITRLRVNNPKYPGKPYSIFKLEGISKKTGNKEIRYYDLPRNEDGTVDFSNKIFYLKLLNKKGISGNWFLLKWLFESMNPDEEGEFILNDIYAGKRGDLGFSFIPPGKKKTKNAAFKNTRYDDEHPITITRLMVNNPKYPGRPYSIFKLEGISKKTGNPSTRYYDLPRNEDGSIDIYKSTFNFLLLNHRDVNDQRFFFRWLFESENPDTGGEVSLSLDYKQPGTIPFFITPWGSRKTEAINFTGVPFDENSSVSLTRLRVNNPKYPGKPYSVYKLEGLDKKSGEKEVRYYDLPRNKDGSIDFSKKRIIFKLLRHKGANNDLFHMRWFLESGDPDVASQRYSWKANPNNTGGIEISFKLQGETKVRSATFSTGYEANTPVTITRLKINNPKYPDRPYCIFRLEGKDKKSQKLVIRYYDFPRHDDGSIDFSKYSMSFQKITSDAIKDQRFVLKWLLESEDPDSGREIFLPGITSSSSGNITLSINLRGTNKNKRALFSGTGFVGPVTIHSYRHPAKRERLFVLRGETPTGDRYERVYALRRNDEGKPNFKGNCFQLISIHWLGNRKYDAAISQVWTLIERVSADYQISDVNEFCGKFPRLVRRIVQRVAKEDPFTSLNPRELESIFWRTLLNMRFFGEGWGVSGQRKIEANVNNPEAGRSVVATQRRLDRFRFEDEEVLYSKFRLKYLREGKYLDEVLEDIHDTAVSTPAEEIALKRLTTELETLQEVERDIYRNNILKPGIRLEVYQLEGIWKILQRGSLILGDEVGLGKTLQILVAMALGKTGKGMIVGPKSALGMYVRELSDKLQVSVDVHLMTSEKNMDIVPAPRANMRVKTVTEEKEEFLKRWFKMPKTPGKLQLLVTNYEQLVGLSTDFSEIPEQSKLDLLVVDEAQRVKNEKANRTSATYGIPRERTVLLSATIVDNAAEDLRMPLKELWEELTAQEKEQSPQWSALSVVAPHLKTAKKFLAMLDPGAEESGISETQRAYFLEQLQHAMQEVMVRRRAENVLQNKLPQKDEELVRLSLERGEMFYKGKTINLGGSEKYAAQRELYLTIANDMEILPAARKHYLRQVLSNPSILMRERNKEEEFVHLAKVQQYVRALEKRYGDVATWRSIKQDAIKTIIREEENKRITLFSRYIGVVENLSQQEGWDGLASMLDGQQLTLREREERIQKFKRGKTLRLASTYGVGGVAVDFTADTAQKEELLIIESWPEKGSELRQAIGRQYRRATDNRIRLGEKLRVLQFIANDIGGNLTSIDERDRMLCQYKDLVSSVLENGVLVWSIFSEMKKIEAELDRRLFPDTRDDQTTPIEEEEFQEHSDQLFDQAV